MKLLTQMVLLLIAVAYIVIGGLIFHYLEGDNELQTRDRATINLLEFLENKTCVTPEELKNLLTVTFNAYQNGLITFNNTVDPIQPNWDYYSAIFFAMTVVTTIGYGNISPVTVNGRVFCVAFALIGIPLFLVVAASLGTNLFKVVKKCQKCCFEEDVNGKLSRGARACGSIFYIGVGIGLFIAIPGVIFGILEDWSYLEGIYYAFITLTTIGFGDFVPGTEDDHAGFRPIYRLCVAGWIFIGLSWMAGVLSSIQEHYTETIQEREENGSKSGRASRLNSRSEGRVNAVQDQKSRLGSAQKELVRAYSVDAERGLNGSPTQTPPYPVTAGVDDDVFLTKL